MRLLRLALMLSMSVLSQTALAHAITAQIDLRGVLVDSPLESFTEGGTGELRFGHGDDGLRLGKVMIDAAGNTWMGEEFRTIGVETSLTALGASAGRNFDVSVVASAFGWNDPAGILLFQRGWGIHDRQTALFGELPRPFIRNPAIPNVEFFDEVDGRYGYYAGLETKLSGRHVLRALHYDNRGDTAENDAREPAWLTRLDSFGARLEFPLEITAITQYMQGDTAVGASADGRGRIIVDCDSWFLLVSQKHGSHRYTARYDRMNTETVRGAQYFNSDQDADAWTAAYLFDFTDHWQFAAEAIQLSGSLRQRANLGLPASATEQRAIARNFPTPPGLCRGYLRGGYVNGIWGGNERSASQNSTLRVSARAR